MNHMAQVAASRVPCLPAPRLPWNPLLGASHIPHGDRTGRRAADTETSPLCPEHHPPTAGLQMAWAEGIRAAYGVTELGNCSRKRGRWDLGASKSSEDHPLGGNERPGLPSGSITRGRSTQTN